MGEAIDGPRENITLIWLGWESEGFVVARNPGNSGGAKGPCRERVFHKKKGTPLGRNSHYGNGIDETTR
jgi:hypothetical protein